MAKKKSTAKKSAAPVPPASRYKSGRALANRGKSDGELSAGIWSEEEAVFRRDIHAAPRDDDPRLVYADWLEERGDLRSEFIRVQCRLAKLRARDPEYAGLAAREEALERKYRAEWMRPYPDVQATCWGVDASNWRLQGNAKHYFTRGLPSIVQPRSASSFVKRASLFFDELGMHEVVMSLKEPAEATRLAAVPQLAKVDALLVRRRCDLEPLLSSSHLGPLKRLNLTCYDRPDGLRRFLSTANAATLEWVWVHGSQMAPPVRETLEALLQAPHLGKLDTLVLEGHGKALSDLLAAPSDLAISQLQLEGSHLSANWPDVAHSPALAHVVTLAVDHPDFMPNAAADLWTLPPAVRTLRFRGITHEFRYGPDRAVFTRFDKLLAARAMEQLE